MFKVLHGTIDSNKAPSFFKSVADIPIGNVSSFELIEIASVVVGGRDGLRAH